MSGRGWRDLLRDAANSAGLSLHARDDEERWELRAEAEWLLGEAVAARGLLLSSSSSNKWGRGRFAAAPTPTLVEGAPVHDLLTSGPGGKA
jgi:hypothetical protein